MAGRRQSDVALPGQSDPALPADHTGDYSRINPYAPPCLGRKCACQRGCEYAWCCRAVGRCGIDACSTPKARVRLLGFATVFNVVNLAFTMLATFSMSYNGPIVRNTCWSRARIQNVNTSMILQLWNSEGVSVPEARCELADPPAEIADLDVFIGLSGVAWSRYKQQSDGDSSSIDAANREPLCKDPDTVFTPWEHASLCNPDAVFAGLNTTGVHGDLLTNSSEHGVKHANKISGFCTRCRDSAVGFGTAMILAVVTCIPTIQTDIQRAYRKYDLNCQKFLAVFVGGLFSCLNTLASFAGFLDNCRRGLPEKPFSSSASVSDVRARWDLGIGLTLLIIATFFKLVDAAIHCAIKTPEVCHMNQASRIAHGKKVGTVAPNDVEMS